VSSYIHAAIGNVNVDVYLYVERLPGPDDVITVKEALIGLGGAATNYAVAVARAGHRPRLVAHTTKHVSAMGLLENLRKEGVELDALTIHSEGLPGIVVVLVLPTGDVSMIKIRGVNELLTGDEVVQALPATVVHFASVPPSIVERACRATGGFAGAKLVTYDPGGAVVEYYAGHVVNTARQCVDMLTVNARELEMLIGRRDVEAARGMIGGRLSSVLVRIGGGGAYLLTKNASYHVYGFHYGRPLDTTGAGDTFNAYLNVFLAEDRGFEEALAAASIAAGIKVTRRGAQSSPHRHEVEELLAKHGGKLVRRIG
jgi:ribokinase